MAHNESSQVCKVCMNTSGKDDSVCEKKREEKRSNENCNNSQYINVNELETIMHKCR